MSEPLAYFNGVYRPLTQVSLALNDAGFVFGATATDLCRTFRHKLFRLEDHLRRFRRSCDLASIPQLLSDEELGETANELVQHNGQLIEPRQDLALVMFATPGPIGYYLGQSGGPGDERPTLCLYTFPLPFERYSRLFREGARLIIPKVRHVPAECVSPNIKQRSRLHWWLAEQEVHQVDPTASALLLDLQSRVTETAAANFLLVQNGRVRSPRRDYILGGISLLVVEELCGELTIPFEEAELTESDCYSADEAMLASTPYCLAPVGRINEHALAWPGPIFRRLIEAWSAMAAVDIRGQVLS